MDAIVVITDAEDGKGVDLQIVTPKGRILRVLVDNVTIQDERKKDGLIVPKLIIE